jgi:hypothetical protein
VKLLFDVVKYAPDALIFAGLGVPKTRFKTRNQHGVDQTNKQTRKRGRGKTQILPAMPHQPPSKLESPIHGERPQGRNPARASKVKGTTKENHSHNFSLRGSRQRIRQPYSSQQPAQSFINRL